MSDTEDLEEVQYAAIMRDYMAARKQKEAHSTQQVAKVSLTKRPKQTKTTAKTKKVEEVFPKRMGKTKKDRDHGCPNRRREMVQLSRQIGRRLSQEEIVVYRQSGNLPGAHQKGKGGK